MKLQSKCTLRKKIFLFAIDFFKYLLNAIKITLLIIEVFSNTSVFKCVISFLLFKASIVIRYVCMMSTLLLVKIYNAEHLIAGQDIQHHLMILLSKEC